MLVPVDGLAYTGAAKAKADHLLWCPAEGILLWIAANEDNPYVIFLNGEHPLVGYSALGVEGWEGIQIGPIDVRVDPSSAHVGSGLAFGTLRITKGVVGLSIVTDENGRKENVPIVLRKDVQTPEFGSLHFSRWSIGIMDGEEWHELVKVEDGKITPLFLPAA